jgi:hypothetical protein
LPSLPATVSMNPSSHTRKFPRRRNLLPQVTRSIPFQTFHTFLSPKPKPDPHCSAFPRIQVWICTEPGICVSLGLQAKTSGLAPGPKWTKSIHCGSGRCAGFLRLAFCYLASHHTLPNRSLRQLAFHLCVWPRPLSFLLCLVLLLGPWGDCRSR